MKIKSITKAAIFILIMIFSQAGNAQNTISIGGYLGGGVISGTGAGEGGYTTSLFFQFNPVIMDDANLRLSFFYARDFSQLLGETRRYYPLMKGFSLKAIVNQPVTEKVYLEEGIGLITINDRTFNNVNEWNYGVAFSLLAGIDFRKNLSKGLRTGLGVDYGITFHNTYAKYFSFHLQTQFIF